MSAKIIERLAEVLATADGFTGTVGSIDFDHMNLTTVITARWPKGTPMREPLLGVVRHLHDYMRSLPPHSAREAFDLVRAAELALQSASTDERALQTCISEHVTKELGEVEALRRQVAHLRWALDDATTAAQRDSLHVEAYRARVRSLAAIRAMRINPADPRKAP